MIFTEEMINCLRGRVEKALSAKRFAHTLGVEKCAMELGMRILPYRVDELRAAALLHDIAKEIPKNEQIALLKEANMSLSTEDFSSEGVIHSFCAPLIVRRDFAEFATDDILSAVFNHTVGAPGMSVFDKIIFISDYVEEGRTYASCKNVREFLFSEFEQLSYDERIERLDKACLMSIDGALKALERMGTAINSRMYETRNSLLK